MVWISRWSGWLVLAAWCALLLGVAPNAGAATVAYWRLDNDGKIAGQTAGVVVDEEGTHDGAGSNSPTYSSDVFAPSIPLTGAANTLSLDFERDDTESVNVPHDPALSFGSNPFTIEAWVKLETLGDPGDSATRAFLLQKKGNAGQDRFQDYAFLVQIADRGSLATAGVGKQTGFTGQELGYTWGDGVGQFFVVSTLEINDTSWHYASMAFDGSDTVRFRLDGQTEVVTGLAALGHTTNAGALNIGARTTGAGSITDPFDGLIDELRISAGVVSHQGLLVSALQVPALPRVAAGLLGLLLVGALAWLTIARRSGKQV